MDAMKSTHDEIALQGIEFWSNVCDEEYELQLLQQDVRLKGNHFLFSLSFTCRHRNKVVNPNEPVVTTLAVLCPI